jgi:alpha-glucosidase (family GH31 glycosyl hydrolase)
MRPLWMMYPEDNNTLGIDTNYMFGVSYLVAATTPQLDKIKYYLPI